MGENVSKSLSVGRLRLGCILPMSHFGVVLRHDVPGRWERRPLLAWARGETDIDIRRAKVDTLAPATRVTRERPCGPPTWIEHVNFAAVHGRSSCCVTVHLFFGQSRLARHYQPEYHLALV